MRIRPRDSNRSRLGAACLGSCTALFVLSSVATSAGAAAPPASTGGTVCRHTAYTGDGGYFSAGTFFWEPSDTVTLKVQWCSSGTLIRSKRVTYTSAIPSTLDPRFIESDTLARGGKLLKVTVSGSFDSGVINNSGFIELAGHVAANGNRHFADLTADEG